MQIDERYFDMAVGKWERDCALRQWAIEQIASNMYISDDETLAVVRDLADKLVAYVACSAPIGFARDE